MIVVRVQGGLGNQMFQYALFRRIQLERKDVELDLSSFVIDGRRNFELETVFDIKCREFRLPSYEAKCKRFAGSLRLIKWSKPFGALVERSLCRFLGRRLEKMRSRSVIVNDDHLVSVEEYLKEANVFFVGYWQSSEYFKGVESEIRAAFRFPEKSIGSLEPVTREIEESESIAVHFRRGDYYSNPHFAEIYADICDETYYQRAIGTMRELFPSARYFAFSDDPEWLRRQDVFRGLRHKIMSNATNSSPWSDMFLMSKCKHIVIANSTFSWWAAWLNESPGKKVVAPARWLNSGSSGSLSDVDHLLEHDWIKV